MPIRQFVRCKGRWFERTVGLSEDRLAFGLSPFPTVLKVDAPEGAVREVRPAADAVARAIGETLAAKGKGAALFIDYGYENAVGGETLQAVRRHAHVDVLETPGEADLSAHVDFSALRAAAEAGGACVHGPVGQGDFLLALGLLERAGQLGSGADAAAQDEIHAAVQRLAGEGPGEMGRLFKVQALTPSNTALPGF